MRFVLCSVLLAMLVAEVPARERAPKRLKKYEGPWQTMRDIAPQQYVCYHTKVPLTIDGKTDELAWAKAAWTKNFVDIEGARKPTPRFRTRAKMVWDDKYLYMHAELEEPHVWGTITKQNAVMYNDNDFEIFIDPDGDNHNYYEFEMNALNTIWELSLRRPYMDGSGIQDPNEIPGVLHAVRVLGTLNDPRDTDIGWHVEVAIPWKALREFTDEATAPPVDGDQWRIGFSRVEWLVDIIDGRYRKIPRTTRREDNWVWSPQGVINMHRPERWGFVQFSTAEEGEVPFVVDPTIVAKEFLMEVYYRQRSYRAKFKRWAGSFEALGIDPLDHDPSFIPVDIELTTEGYVATVWFGQRKKAAQHIHVNQVSHLWQSPAPLRAR